MRYYNITNADLNNNNYWNRMVNDIKSSLLKEGSLNNKVLVIKLQDVVNDDTTMIPKLEFYKENS